MRKFLKNIASAFLPSLVRWYLRKEREYKYEDLVISVMPGVFHPGLFSSTGLILKYLDKQCLKNQTLLEVGCGSGLISIMAAKQQAEVTALDISKSAVANTRKNAARNHAKIHIIHSNLFTQLHHFPYDWIIINPPYYPYNPANDSEHAWYCGKNHEYFRELFKGIPPFIKRGSQVIMVLTKECQLNKIFGLGKEAGFRFELIQETNAFFDEKDLLYRIHATAFDTVEV
jgi:release factor glutamine methyltransferase